MFIPQVVFPFQMRMIRMKKVMMEPRPNHTRGNLVKSPVYRGNHIFFFVSLCVMQTVSLQLHVSCAGETDPSFTADEETLFTHRYENGYDLTHDARYNLWLQKRKESKLVLYFSIRLFPFVTAGSDVPAVPATKLAKFLFIPPALGKRKYNNVNSGARVLTSKECVQMLEEKEKKKREVAELKERRKVIREERKKKKILEAQERVTRKKGALLNSSATVCCNYPSLFSGTKHPQKNVENVEEMCEAYPCNVSLCDQPVVKWVQCENCSKWFHLFCIGVDGVHDDWACKLCA